MNNNDPLDITFEILKQDPDIYRNQLMTLVQGLDWERSVWDYHGDQSWGIVRFCLDFHNIDLIGDSVNRTMVEKKPISKDVLATMDQIDAFNPSKRDNSKDLKEKVARKRLLAWINFFDEIMKSSEVEVNNISSENQNSAA
ncbi:MAG: hypothetical protein AAB459_00535 [Patescibacteria group bacterium]